MRNRKIILAIIVGLVMTIFSAFLSYFIVEDNNQVINETRDQINILEGQISQQWQNSKNFERIISTAIILKKINPDDDVIINQLLNHSDLQENIIVKI